jgi:hypothetical protein
MPGLIYRGCCGSKSAAAARIGRARSQRRGRSSLERLVVYAAPYFDRGSLKITDLGALRPYPYLPLDLVGPFGLPVVSFFGRSVAGFF